jgi:hypothetical protein
MRESPKKDTLADAPGVLVELRLPLLSTDGSRGMEESDLYEEGGETVVKPE